MQTSVFPFDFQSEASWVEDAHHTSPARRVGGGLMCSRAWSGAGAGGAAGVLQGSPAKQVLVLVISAVPH